MMPLGPAAVDTASVVLWMLVYQRMNPDTSLEMAVKNLLDVRPQILPDNKRVTNKTLSSNTSTYSQARKRMPREAAAWFAGRVSETLIAATEPTFQGRRVFEMDGTTITLAPEAALQAAFPPASNQYGEGVWPVALLVVAHEMASGAATIPEVGAMYGEQAVSETALARPIIQRLPPDSILMADSNFGIFAMAHDTQSAGHSFVFRMTASRFKSLRKKATLVEETANSKVYTLKWEPSGKERKAHPDIPLNTSYKVRLHEIVINEHLTLQLVTNLPDSTAALAGLYQRRTDIETDIRNLKIVLDAERIRARSVDMFHKELLLSMVSYNLVSQFRRQAAELINEPPRRMSFKRTWTTFGVFLLPHMHTDPAAWRERYRVALGYATQDKLPNRPNRKFPRETYPRRPKSNQFKTRKRKPKEE